MSLVARIALSALARPATHAYGRHPSQVADLHVPRGRGPFPVAVVLHGGYWSTRYGKLVTRPLALDLARRGWAAWNVEYRRLGEGPGAGGGWPATFEDVAAAVDHLAALGDPRLDLDRVGVVGHSAGGQLALWAAGRPGLPPGAPGAEPSVALTFAVALTPVTRLAAAGRVARMLMGGAPDAVPERYDLADPIRRVPLPLPVLLVHPRDDATVSVEHSRQYAQAAGGHGADVTLIEPVSGGHTGPIHPKSGAWAAAARWLESRAAATASHPPEAPARPAPSPATTAPDGADPDAAPATT